MRAALPIPPGAAVGRSVGEALAIIERSALPVPALTQARRRKTPLPPSRTRLILEIPGLVVKSEANIGGKVRSRIARKTAVKAAMAGALPDRYPLVLDYPVRVRLVRVGRRKLDGDNLQHAFKAVRDVVAAWLQVDDGDTERVRWSYAQRPGWWAGIRIEIG